MPKNKKTTVKEWYDTLPANKQAVLRNKIMEECEFSPNTFYRMINGKKLPTRLEKQAIEKIAGQSLNFNIELPVSLT